MTDALCLVATQLLLLWCFVDRPTRWHAPVGWYIDGARPDGRFEMRPAPLGDPNADGTWGHPDVTPDDERAVEGRVYCTGGAHPIVAGPRVVGCQR